jgi:hypothetical protein
MVVVLRCNLPRTGGTLFRRTIQYSRCYGTQGDRERRRRGGGRRRRIVRKGKRRGSRRRRNDVGKGRRTFAGFGGSPSSFWKEQRGTKENQWLFLGVR